MKTLEKIVNTVRICPHGTVVGIIALGLSIAYFNQAFSDPNLFSSIKGYGSLFLVGMSLGNISHSLTKYSKTKEILKNHGFNKKHVKVNLRHYCDRQAYKAAAYSCGFSKEFNEVNKKYPKELKIFSWVPEL